MLSVGHCHLGTKRAEMTLAKRPACVTVSKLSLVRAVDKSSLQDSLSLPRPRSESRR